MGRSARYYNYGKKNNKKRLKGFEKSKPFITQKIFLIKNIECDILKTALKLNS